MPEVNEKAKRSSFEKIDSVVRPFYCNGVETVVEAFRQAKDLLSVDLMSKRLDQLDYLYPYHQVIGFLMEYTGIYSDSQLAIFEKRPMKHEFYVQHQMKNPSYSHRWKLYYPNSLDLKI